MKRTHCVLALLTLYVGSAHCFSWDIVVGRPEGLKFYNNGTLTHTEKIPSAHIHAITYDAAYNRVLFSDNSNASVLSSFDITTKKIQTLLRCKTADYLRFAFNPPTETVFWIGTDGIYSFSLKVISNEAVDGSLIIQMKERPRGIAVDSCEGYVYWVTDNLIERARFGGSKREVIINKYVNWRADLAIDPQTQKMYWIDRYLKNVDVYMSIESADLNGRNRKTVYSGLNEITYGTITLSRDFIYWSGLRVELFWKLPKNETDVEPKINSMRNTEICYNCESFAAYYKLEDLTQGSQLCGPLSGVLSQLCVHGSKVNGESVCKCDQGYTGSRCDVSICQNYCFQGDCTAIDQQPKCRCYGGYSGERCEVYGCHGYCVNGGVCSLNDKREPVCKCTEGYKGERCNVPVCQHYCFQGVCNVTADGQPKCRCNPGYYGERCEVYGCQGYCLNNGICSMNDKSKPICQCTGDFKGERCNVSDCQNYCVQGDCSLGDDGKRKCRCFAGNSGERCEINGCHGYCLNSGVCSLNSKGEPVCQCTKHYKGERCDVGQGNCKTNAQGDPNCRCDADDSNKKNEPKQCQGYCYNNGVCTLNEELDPVCKCTVDFKDTRCNVSVCQNHCYHGDCSIGADGAKCGCFAGYSGDRCEINACQGHCLNNGVCSMNAFGEPSCQCAANYEGERCEASVPDFLMKCFRMVSSLSSSKGILNPVAPSSQSNSGQGGATTP